MLSLISLLSFHTETYSFFSSERKVGRAPPPPGATQPGAFPPSSLSLSLSLRGSQISSSLNIDRYLRRVFGWLETLPAALAPARCPPPMALANTLAALLATIPALPLRVAGLGRYSGSPAVFLVHTRSERVLPVPVPLDAVGGLQQALSPSLPSRDQLVPRSRALARRDGGLLDSLPWDWAPSPLAKRNAAARLEGRDYAREGHSSPYALLLEAARLDACVDVADVLIERTDALGGLVLGGAVLVRPAAGALDPGAPDSMCECTADEAIGLALALGCEVQCDEEVWLRGCVAPTYSLEEEGFRLQVTGDVGDAASPPTAMEHAATLPWEVRSVAELREMPLEDKARSALAAGLRLPRPRLMTDEAIDVLLEPFLDEAVRRELRIAHALEAGDVNLAARLEAGSSRRSVLLAKLRDFVTMERFGAAAQVAAELQIETERRADLYTLAHLLAMRSERLADAYSPLHLLQDDWYTEQLTRERRRLLEEESGVNSSPALDNHPMQEEGQDAGEVPREALCADEGTAAPADDPHTGGNARTDGISAGEETEREREGTKEEGSEGTTKEGDAMKEDSGEVFKLAPPLRAPAAAEAGAATRPWEPSKEWDAEIEASVLMQMLGAFDNYPSAEVEELLLALVSAAAGNQADAGRAIREIVILTSRLEELQEEIVGGTARNVDAAYDELRTLRSQLRMWAKKGEKWTSGGAEDAEPGWLSWLRGLQ
eukprot:scaffold40994_cov30-Tisochrysis_lutea.AAC.2